jgi:hypothetical protein
LYNGNARWQAPTQMSEVAENLYIPVKELMDYIKKHDNS